MNWFNARKAAQVVAFFADKEGGKINVLKLAKLVYLADRAFMAEYDSPILHDQLVSMEHGPVNSITLNLINGLVESADWDAFVTDRERHDVGAARAIEPGILDELSEAELEVLNAVWARFGHMDPYAIRDYTHEYCPEWEDPEGSSAPIPYERVFKFLEKPDVRALARDVQAARGIRHILDKVRHEAQLEDAAD